MLVMIVSMSVASLIVNDCGNLQKGREPSHSLGSRDYLIILFISNLTTSCTHNVLMYNLFLLRLPRTPDL